MLVVSGAGEIRTLVLYRDPFSHSLFEVDYLCV